MKYAHVIEGSVHAIYHYDPLPELAPSVVMIELPENSPVRAGWQHVSGSEFVAPAEEESAARHVTVLAFLSRFKDPEAVAIDLASMGATVQAASLRRYMSKVTSASFIDLARDDTRAGVQQLETFGLIAAGRAAEILDAEIEPLEMPK